MMAITNVIDMNGAGEYIVKKEFLEVILPKKYFDRKISEFVTDKINTLGLFDMYAYDDPDGEGKYKKYVMRFPSMILLTPSNIREETVDGEFIYVLEFYKNSIFTESNLFTQSTDPVVKYVDMLFNNYIPKQLSYTTIYTMLKLTATLNKVNYKVPSMILQMIVSEMCRNPNNPNEPFRLLLTKKPDTSESGRQLISLKELSKYATTFGAVSSGYISFGLSRSVINAKTGANELDSTIEKNSL